MNLIRIKNILSLCFFLITLGACSPTAKKNRAVIAGLKENQYLSKNCYLCPSAFYKSKHCKGGKDEIKHEIFGCGFLNLGCRAICEEKFEAEGETK